MLKQLLAISMFCFFLAGCKDDADSFKRELQNPFNSPFLSHEIDFELLNNYGLTLSDDEGEIAHLTYDTDSVLLVLDVKFLGEYDKLTFFNDRFEVYGVTYRIQQIHSLDSIEIGKRMEQYDADVISTFINTADSTSYFFVRHRFNNIIYRCIVNLKLDHIEVSLRVPILNKKEIEKKRQNYVMSEI